VDAGDQRAARSGPGSLEHSVGQDQSEKAYRRYEVREALAPFQKRHHCGKDHEC